MVKGEKPGRTTAEQRLVWHDIIEGDIQWHERQSEGANCIWSSNIYLQWAAHMCAMRAMHGPRVFNDPMLRNRLP